MRIYLIAVGTRMPRWVKEGFYHYATRLPKECSLQLIEIPTGKRNANPIERVVCEEGERLLAATPVSVTIIALDSNGSQWTTEQLAEQLNRWLNEGHNIALLVGGPDGLAGICRERAQAVWSLSKLTFPHLLVRIIVAEQIYRAWSILHHHSYHRA